MVVWTERGSVPFLPFYGIRRTVGYGSTGAAASVLRLNLREAALSDTRVQEVSGIRFWSDGDAYVVDVDVVPVGYGTARSVPVSLG